jgi:three-Cys-motif partner protein
MKESQQTMMQHSEVKIRLLKLYLERYLNVLSVSQFFGDIYLYDLFCGEGIYENNGKGSPIVILETIKNTYFANKAKGAKTDKFICHFNDIESWKIQKLKTEVSNRKLHYSEIGEVNYSEDDYREKLSEVASKINGFKKEKAFVFIDPYGYKEIKVSDIKSLLKSGKSEVLLFLPTQFMFRFEKQGTPECLVDFISELMPVEQWPASETGIDFIENLTEAFRKTLGEHFVDSFIITRDKNQFFCLFFFTSHIYGFDRMLDAKWTIDEEEGRGWQYESENTLFNQTEKKANTYKFERKLIDFLKTEKTNSQLYQFTLHNGHLPSHTNEILIKLQDEGKLTALKNDGTKARKSSFYINYKDYKNEPSKIKLKIK